MKHLKTFESFSVINEEEIFSGVKKFLYGDKIEDELIPYLVKSGKKENMVKSEIDKIKSEKDITAKNKLFNSLIGDESKAIQNGVKINDIRKELGLLTKDEEKEYWKRKGSKGHNFGSGE